MKPCTAPVYKEYLGYAIFHTKTQEVATLNSFLPSHNVVHFPSIHLRQLVRACGLLEQVPEGVSDRTHLRHRFRRIRPTHQRHLPPRLGPCEGDTRSHQAVQGEGRKHGRGGESVHLHRQPRQPRQPLHKPRQPLQNPRQRCMDRQRHRLTHAPHPGGEPPSGRHRRAVRDNRCLSR